MNYFVARYRELFSKSTDCRLCLRSMPVEHPQRKPSKNFPEICHGCSTAEASRIRYNNRHKRNRRKPTGKIALQGWLTLLKAYAWSCAFCGARGRYRLSIDHIAQLHDGGTNTVDNVMPLCLKCHAKKDDHAKRPFSKLRRRYREFRMYMWHTWHISLPKFNKR